MENASDFVAGMCRIKNFLNYPYTWYFMSDHCLSCLWGYFSYVLYEILVFFLNQMIMYSSMSWKITLRLLWKYFKTIRWIHSQTQENNIVVLIWHFGNMLFLPNNNDILMSLGTNDTVWVQTHLPDCSCCWIYVWLVKSLVAALWLVGLWCARWAGVCVCCSDRGISQTLWPPQPNDTQQHRPSTVLCVCVFVYFSVFGTDGSDWDHAGTAPRGG